MSSLHSRLLDDAEEAAATAAAADRHPSLPVSAPQHITGSISGPPNARHALRTAPQPVVGRGGGGGGGGSSAAGATARGMPMGARPRQQPHNRGSSNISISSSSHGGTGRFIGTGSPGVGGHPHQFLLGSSFGASGSSGTAAALLRNLSLSSTPLGTTHATMGSSPNTMMAPMGSSLPRSSGGGGMHSQLQPPPPSSRHSTHSNSTTAAGSLNFNFSNNSGPTPSPRREPFGFMPYSSAGGASGTPQASASQQLQQMQQSPTPVPSSVHNPPPDSPSMHSAAWADYDERHLHQHHQHQQQQHYTPGTSDACGTLVSSDSFGEQAGLPGSSMPVPLRGYLVGQIANVLKLGVWWTLFGPLLLSLFHGHVYGIALTRLAFNTSLMLASPLAAILVERVRVRSILLWTVAGRGLIYGALLPLVYTLLETNWIIDHHHADSKFATSSASTTFPLLMLCFFVLLFLDGMIVAASNVVDIDCAGAALVARQSASPLRAGLQVTLATAHEHAFEAAMILLAPLVAVAAQYACGLFAEDHDSSAPGKLSMHLSAPTLLFALALVFILCTLVSLVCYAWLLPRLSVRQFARAMAAEETVLQDGSTLFVMPALTQGDGGGGGGDHYHLHSGGATTAGDVGGSLDHHLGMESDAESLNGGDGPSSDDVGSAAMMGGGGGLGDFGEDSGGAYGQPPTTTTITPKRSIVAEIRYMRSMLLVGARLCWRTPALRHRLWLLSMQTAIEDAVISVLIPVVSTLLVMRSFAPLSGEAACVHGRANVLAICVIALGKASGLVMTRMRARGWTGGPETLARWTDLRASHFVAGSVALSCVVLLLFPLAALLLQRDLAAIWANQHDSRGGADEDEIPSDSRIAFSVVLLALGTASFFVLSSLPKFLLAAGIQQAAEQVAADIEDLQLQRDRERTFSYSSNYSEADDAVGDRTGSMDATPFSSSDSFNAAMDADAAAAAAAAAFTQGITPGDDPDAQVHVGGVLIAGVSIDSADVSRSLFGFVAAWLTCVDSALLLLLAGVFALTANGESDLYNRGLVILGGLFLLHGLGVLLGAAFHCASGPGDLPYDPDAAAAAATAHFGGAHDAPGGGLAESDLPYLGRETDADSSPVRRGGHQHHLRHGSPTTLDISNSLAYSYSASMDHQLLMQYQQAQQSPSRSGAHNNNNNEHDDSAATSVTTSPSRAGHFHQGGTGSGGSYDDRVAPWMQQQQQQQMMFSSPQQSPARNSHRHHHRDERTRSHDESISADSTATSLRE